MIYKANTKELVFYLIYGLYMTACLLDATVLGQNDGCALALKALRYVCYLLAALKIIWDDYETRNLPMAVIVFGIVALSVLSCKNPTFGFFLLMIYAARNINTTRIIRLTCVLQGAVLAVFVSLSQIGIVSDYVFDATTRERYGMGFSWVTTGPILYFFFMMSYIWLRKEKMHTLEFVVLELLNVGLFVRTNTRMSFLLSTLMLAYVFVMRFYWMNRKETIYKNRLLLAVPSLVCAVSLVLHIGYDSTNTLWAKLNTTLSNRFSLGYDAFQEYGLSLFGQKITWVGYSYGEVVTDYNYVDCSYMQIMLENGVVMLLLVVALYTYVLYMGIKKKDFYLQTMVLVIIVFSITEPRLINLTYNPFPFFAVSFLGSGEKKWDYDRFSPERARIRFLTPHVRVKGRK